MKPERLGNKRDEEGGKLFRMKKEKGKPTSDTDESDGAAVPLIALFSLSYRASEMTRSGLFFS